MLPRNWQQQGHSPLAEPSRVLPALSARLRLFGLLGVIGPLFAGLHSLVLDVTPPVETTVLISDAASPTPDVVVVETVVERVVYVPIDSLPGAAPSNLTESATIAPAEGRPVAGGGPADEVARDSTQAEQEAAEAEAAAAEQVAAAASAAVPRISPSTWVAPTYRGAPAEAAADEPEQVAEDAEAETTDAEPVAVAPAEDAAPEEEQPVAETPRVVVVHTLTWDGEQFSAVPGEPGEQYVIEGSREGVAEAPQQPPADATAAAADGAAPTEGEPESHQAADGDERMIAEGDGAGDVPSEEAAAQPDDAAATAEAEASEAEQLADAEPQQTDELIVKADEAEPAEGAVDEVVADAAQMDESASEDVQAADQPEDTEQPVADGSEHDPVVKAIEHAAAESVAAIEAAPEIEAEGSEESAEPAATPTVGRNPANEAVEIVLPSN